MSENQVILVDENDIELGSMEKMEAHLDGNLHRAISVFITDSKGKWLLQRRALEKYHSKGLWSNTCCSHPSPGEETPAAAKRRLMQEMGMTAELKSLFCFTYRAELENGLTEHEIDHVFWGVSDVLPNPDPAEIMDYKYLDFKTMEFEIRNNPGLFSEWFKMIYKRVHHSITADNDDRLFR